MSEDLIIVIAGAGGDGVISAGESLQGNRNHHQAEPAAD
jgi:hypothetical protein